MANDNTDLVAVADLRLRVLLAVSAFARLLHFDNPVVGTALTEIFPIPEVAVDLRLLQAGAAREIRLATLENDQCLVASLATSGVADDTPVILVRTRPLAPMPAERPDPLVGRAEQLEAFDEFLAGPDGTMFVLEGPLGIGKSALLRAFERRCRRIGTPLFRLDCRALSFRGEIMSMLAKNQHASLTRFAADVAARPWVLMLDHFDVGLTTSIAERADFFAALPESCRLVVAVRAHSKPFPFLFPRHKPVLCRLGVLSPTEVDILVSLLGIQDERGVSRAGGHPLSLRALAPSITHGEPLDDVAYEGELPVPRAALKVAALPRRITEDLLVALLDDAELAGRTYDALASICMTDPENFGLRMPEVLRAPLAARLERRNPARFAALRVEIVRYQLRRLERTEGEHRRHTIDDLFDSFEGHPRLRAVFGTVDPTISIRRLARESADEVRAFLRQIGRSDAAAILVRLRGSTPTYVAERNGRIVGLLQFSVVSSELLAGDDRRFRPMFRQLGGSDERRIGVLFTFALPADEERAWGEVAQALAREHLRLLLRHRDLTASVVLAETAMRVIDQSSDELVEIDGARVRLRDFRKTPLVARLEGALQQSESSHWLLVDQAPVRQAAVSADAVRTALANLAEGADDPRLVAAIEGLQDQRQRAVLRAIYIDRRGKHELIAAEMGVPYSTFRRHHARGIEQLRQLLIDP